MLAWLRNVNIAILVSHVSWNVLTSSGFHLGPIYRGAEGKSEWSNGGGCKKISSFFSSQFFIYGPRAAKRDLLMILGEFSFFHCLTP